ncbi:hypothetical protein FRC12_020568 [Ceratobasidium sp. 428]|nr:hypothetical protein FRC12_020568 [Ceratobasidium sp. 428]
MPQVHRANTAGRVNRGGAGNVDGNASDESDNLELGNATNAQLQELVTGLQVERTNLKRQITELTRERDDLLAAQAGRRRRRRAAPQEPVPVDFKYKHAGKRCALLYMLWVTPDLHEIQIDDTYTDEMRYSNETPEMRAQGERKDMLLSMSQELIPGFNEEEHFRKVEDFRDLLGYQPEETVPSKKYPTMAPVLYRNGRVGDPQHEFRSFYIKDVFRAIMFGPSSVIEGQDNDAEGPQVLADALSIKAITPGAIAAAATWTRWVISPDKEFRKVGRETGIQWRNAYQNYKELIIRGLLHEKTIIDNDGPVGPYTTLLQEWDAEFFSERNRDNRDQARNAADADADVGIEAAIARAEAFGALEDSD